MVRLLPLSIVVTFRKINKLSSIWYAIIILSMTIFHPALQCSILREAGRESLSDGWRRTAGLFFMTGGFGWLFQINMWKSAYCLGFLDPLTSSESSLNANSLPTFPSNTQRSSPIVVTVFHSAKTFFLLAAVKIELHSTLFSLFPTPILCWWILNIPLHLRTSASEIWLIWHAAISF